MTAEVRYRQPKGCQIDVDVMEELSFWCRRLDCTQGELLAAVKAVGVYAKDVRTYLRRKGVQSAIRERRTG